MHPESLEVEVDTSLAGTPYKEFHGRALRGRTDGGRPSRERLEGRYGAPG